MIYLWNEPDLPRLPFLNSFTGVKIRANLAAYGTGYSFLTVWIQRRDEKITAVLCRQEQTMFVAADPAADPEELREFCLAVGFDCLQGDPTLLAAMGFGARRYALLRLENHTPNKHVSHCLPQEAPPLREVYRILYAQPEPDIEPIDPDGWYADLSHRIRHGLAAAVTLEHAATAVASHILPEFAVISGVAVLPDRRGAGLGSRAVQELLCGLTGRRVYVAASNGRCSFYEKLGFCRCGTVGITVSKHE